MNTRPPSDPCERAEKQFTATVLNRCAGRLSEGCAISVDPEGCASTTLGDLIVEAADLIVLGYCNRAADCLSAVNEGIGLTTGARTCPTTESPAAPPTESPASKELAEPKPEQEPEPERPSLKGRRTTRVRR